METAAAGAGGLDVWVKRPPAGDEPGEILATRGAYDRVLQALQAASGREGAEEKLEPSNSPAGLRTADLQILHQGQPVSRWRVREVAQLRRAAVIIDDLGSDLPAAHRLLDLPYALTFSVLPDLPHSAETAREAHAHGREVILHLPLEPEPGAPTSPGPGEIKVGMPAPEVGQLLGADLASVPYARGVNNHMGSRATADPALMAALMKELAARRLYFIDSRTTTETCALSAARRAGVASFYRSVFLDDTETVDYTLGQLQRFRQVIDEQGMAIAIGHPHPSTLAALARFLPELERDDIQLVPASEIVRLPQSARLSPPPAPAKEK